MSLVRYFNPRLSDSIAEGWLGRFLDSFQSRLESDGCRGPPSSSSGYEDLHLRVTGPRLAVLTAVWERPHLDPDGVAELVRPRLGAISTQAVSDNLHALAGAGLLRRIEPT